MPKIKESKPMNVVFSLASPPISLVMGFAVSALCSACSTAPKDPTPAQDPSPVPIHAAPTVDLRIQELEAKISGLNDKLELTKAALDDLKLKVKNQIGGDTEEDGEVRRHPASLPTESGAGQTPTTTQASNDPEAGFVHDESVELFRKSMILYRAQKFPEAVLSFSEFIERHPDHALAGSAQFYIAESYTAQKEFKLAVQEYQVELSQYNLSPHLSDALKGLASSSEALGNEEQARGFRSTLQSLYPASPAAGDQKT